MMESTHQPDSSVPLNVDDDITTAAETHFIHVMRQYKEKSKSKAKRYHTVKPREFDVVEQLGIALEKVEQQSREIVAAAEIGQQLLERTRHLEREKSSLSGQFQNVLNELDKMKSARQEAERRQVDVERELADLRTRFSKLKGERNELITTNNQLLEKITSMEEINHFSKMTGSENKRLRARIEELNQCITDLESQLIDADAKHKWLADQLRSSIQQQQQQQPTQEDCGSVSPGSCATESPSDFAFASPSPITDVFDGDNSPPIDPGSTPETPSEPKSLSALPHSQNIVSPSVNSSKSPASPRSPITIIKTYRVSENSASVQALSRENIALHSEIAKLEEELHEAQSECAILRDSLSSQRQQISYKGLCTRRIHEQFLSLQQDYARFQQQVHELTLSQHQQIYMAADSVRLLQARESRERDELTQLLASTRVELAQCHYELDLHKLQQRRSTPTPRVATRRSTSHYYQSHTTSPLSNPGQFLAGWIRAKLSPRSRTTSTDNNTPEDDK